MNLKEALQKNKLKQFIKEQSPKKGDKPKFDAAISSMVKGKSKEVPATSKRKRSDD